LVEVSTLESIKLSRSVKQGRAATDDDTLLRGCSSGTESILDAILELADLDLRGTTNFDDSNTTGQSANALLELILVVIAGCVLHSTSDGINALLNILACASTAHDDRGVLGDDDLFGGAESAEISVLDLLTNVLRHEDATGGDGNILHGVASVVTEARGLDSTDLEAATEFVDDKSSKSFALNVLSDDEERLLLLHAALEEGKDLLHAADLFVNEEHGSVLELNLGGLGISDEVGRDEATIPLETLDVLYFSLERLALRHSDGAVGAELIEDT